MRGAPKNNETFRGRGPEKQRDLSGEGPRKTTRPMKGLAAMRPDLGPLTHKERSARETWFLTTCTPNDACRGGFARCTSTLAKLNPGKAEWTRVANKRRSCAAKSSGRSLAPSTRAMS